MDSRVYLVLSLILCAFGAVHALTRRRLLWIPSRCWPAEPETIPVTAPSQPVAGRSALVGRPDAFHGR